MSGYTKLFNSLLTSTIWEAPDPTRIVWITMLALADRDGLVEASIPGLATIARVNRVNCEAAIAVLMAPDPDSRSTEQDGRRIEAVDGGWWIINHAKYRDKVTVEERRDYLRVKQAESRARRASILSSDVKTVKNPQSKSKKSTKTSNSAPAPAPAPAPEAEKKDLLIAARSIETDFARFWTVYPKKAAKADARKAWNVLDPSADLVSAILTALEVHGRSPQWQQDGGRFIPHPATWLRQRRWDDETVTGRPRASLATNDQMAQSTAYPCTHQPPCPNAATHGYVLQAGAANWEALKAQSAR